MYRYRNYINLLDLQLKWRIMGPNNLNHLLTETTDVSSFDLLGQEVTQGSLTWEDGEAGTKFFR